MLLVPAEDMPTCFSSQGLNEDSMSHHEAFEHHEHPEHFESSKACRLCSTPYSQEHNPSFIGICETCGYKILIVLIILMVISSYIAWIGVL